MNNSTEKIDPLIDLFLSLLGTPYSNLIIVLIISLLPILVIAGTSYAKISIVLNLLKGGFSGVQVPSAFITAVLAILLSCQVMKGVVSNVFDNLSSMDIIASEFSSISQKDQKEAIEKFLNAVWNPWKEFLESNTSEKSRISFSNHQDGALDILTAYLFTELQEAFIVGFLVLVPFLIIDLVVSSLLVGLGMMMVSPMMITLPLKLILFIVADGWLVLGEGLIGAYK